jgi:DNA-3-methyladenine glycosylase II
MVEIRGRRIGPHELQFARETLNAIFGLQVDLTKFYQSTKHNPRVSELVRKFRGVKPPRFPSIFETLVNAISCQQVSVTVGLLLMSRLASIYGRSITLGGQTLHAFPTPQDLSRVDPSNLRRLGFSNSKSKYIIGLAKSIVNNDVSLEEGKLGSMNDEDALNYLRSIPGVGRWSSQYVLLRGLGRLHRFPADDLGAQNGLKKLLGLKYRPDYERTIEIIKPWQPFAGMIYFHLLLDRLDREGSFSIRTS